MTRSKHANGSGTLGLERALYLFFHYVKGLLPADRSEFTTLVILAVLHAQQWARKTVAAVLDLGEEVTFYAVETFVNRGIGVTLRGNNASFLDTD